jgi:uncharacterized protein DUF1559
MPNERPVPGTTEHKRMRQKQWGCACTLMGLLATLVFATIYICLFRRMPLQISKETTYITEPLKSDGVRVDYFSAWEQETYPENIATEENGYRLIVQHVGSPPDASSNHAAQVRQKLGLPVGLKPDMTYQAPEDFLTDYVESERTDDALTGQVADETPSEGDLLDDETSSLDLLTERTYRPWTPDDLPMMEQWLAENQAAIDLIAEATRKPTFHVPFAWNSEEDLLIALPLPEYQRMGDFAHGLSVRANFRIGTGDIDGAIDDLIACKRLGRQLGPGGCAVQVAVGILVELIADSIGISGSLEHPPTKEQLERLINRLGDLPRPAELDETMRFERYMALDFIQNMSAGKDTLDVWGVADRVSSRIPHRTVDWNIVTRQINRHYDALPGNVTVAPPVWDWQAVFSVRARSERMADTIACLVFSGGNVVQERPRRHTCVERMRHIALAMLLYECDHGALPPAFSVDTGGSPLHSWRVLLLPHLGQQELYDKIRLDEPWDSEHNRQFRQEAVPFYQCPSEELAAGQTAYSVVVGPDTPFERGQGRALSDFGPNSANMILVVDVDEPGCWMDPAHNVSQTAANEGINGDLESRTAIGSQHPGGVNVGFRDGSARFLSETIDLELLKKLLRGKADYAP